MFLLKNVFYNLNNDYMDIYDLIFGNKNSSNEEQHIYSNVYLQMNQADDPVEQIVVKSVADLEKNNPNLDTKALEAEAIYLAALIYMKDNYQIDFDIEYLSELLDKVRGEDFQTADRVFSYMVKHGRGLYSQSEANYGIKGYKMNIQLCPDYGSYIKNYFMRAHKIGVSSEYEHFSSPRNCLWKNKIKSCDSPTQRDVYYKIDNSTFELMIPPYNPLVSGRVVLKTENKVKCQSSDGKRTFVFHYQNSISPKDLYLIEMYRNDKGDMVSYHKE